MKNRRTLAEARDELVKAQDESCAVEDAELQVVRELADGRRRAVGIPPGGIEYESIPEALWLQAIGKGWAGTGPLTLKGNLAQVDFAESSAIARTGEGFKHIREVLDLAAPDDDPAQPQTASTSAPQQRKNPGGAPKRYDWDIFWIEIVRIANTPDGLPARPMLMKLLYNRMIERGWEPLPSESAVKQKLSLLYNSLNLNE